MKEAFVPVLVSVLMGLAPQAFAKPEKGKGPPPEAIKACEEKSEGDRVSFETKRGHTLEGTCEMKRDQLIAIPDYHKSRSKPREENGKY